MMENDRLPSEIISEESHKIELAKEELAVTKRIETEKKIFRKITEEQSVELPVELLKENIKVEHLPINQEITEIPEVRTEGDTTIVPIFEERAVVVKKLFLKEEIHLTKISETEKQTIQETIRTEKFTEE